MFGRTHCQWLNVVQTFVWMIWTRNNNGMKRKKKCFWLTLAFSKSEALKIQRSSAGSFRLFFNPSVSLHIYLYLSVFLSAHLCAAPLIALLLWCIPKKILCVCVCVNSKMAMVMRWVGHITTVLLWCQNHTPDLMVYKLCVWQWHYSDR